MRGAPKDPGASDSTTLDQIRTDDVLRQGELLDRLGSMPRHAARAVKALAKRMLELIPKEK